MITALRFATLLLAALSMTAEAAHVLELPQKMSYDAGTYATVNGTLYRYFAIVGGACQVSAIVAAALLAVVTRERRSFRFALAGTVCLLLALVAWAVVVAPVNGRVADTVRADPGRVPELWMALRARWEYGHAAGFVLQLLGFGALVWSVIAGPPARRQPHGNSRFSVSLDHAYGRSTRVTALDLPHENGERDGDQRSQQHDEHQGEERQHGEGRHGRRDAYQPENDGGRPGGCRPRPRKRSGGNETTQICI